MSKGKRGRNLTYNSWHSMMDRCYNPKQHNYRWYGAKGIKVRDYWHTFENFLSDMGERPVKDCTLSRQDHNKNYQPDNCVWEVNNHRPSTIMLTYKGKTKTLKQWASDLHLNADLIYKRINAGWNSEDLLNPVIKMKNGITIVS